MIPYSSVLETIMSVHSRTDKSKSSVTRQ